jgi:hypothetical protein
MHLLHISVTYVKATNGGDSAGDQGTNTYYSGSTDTDHSNAVQRCCSDSRVPVHVPSSFFLRYYITSLRTTRLAAATEPCATTPINGLSPNHHRAIQKTSEVDKLTESLKTSRLLEISSNRGGNTLRTVPTCVARPASAQALCLVGFCQGF